ncbi:ribosomal RNA small subunit methyltransferase, chloroplastic-like [Lycium ferocissimum]|uniref:ribosomal RNA small subunit methyltransferase, chloroplastic-like n=1 Tax=Lycium ferocissimum TaxID=112874 RepID=UPI0028165AE4|nr:ribosomal RNA small subunit methyltransferase, chloroplastic-like [Lycium ferocissimum]
MHSLLHSLLPLSSTPKAPLLLAYDGPFVANSRKTKSLHTITAISKTKSETRIDNKADEDDYYATLKALNSKGRFPRKSLGQHYMLNSSVNEELVAAANVQEGDLVVEIGPGTGSLTNVLVNSGATVLAIEKVLQEDFTKCHIRSHLSTVSQSARNSSGVKPQYAKVVSNLPFNISTEVTKQLLPMGDIFSEVVLLLQVCIVSLNMLPH